MLGIKFYRKGTSADVGCTAAGLCSSGRMRWSLGRGRAKPAGTQVSEASIRRCAGHGKRGFASFVQNFSSWSSSNHLSPAVDCAKSCACSQSFLSRLWREWRSRSPAEALHRHYFLAHYELGPSGAGEHLCPTAATRASRTRMAISPRSVQLRAMLAALTALARDSAWRRSAGAG